MTLPHRRAFLRHSIAAGTSALCVPAFAAQPGNRPLQRKFTMDLVCGAIGVRANQMEAIELAHRNGFESVAPAAGYLADRTAPELDGVLEKLRAANLVWGAAGMPVDFRRDTARFKQGLQELPKLASGLRRAGGTRMSTWIRPGHDTLTYLANFKQHVARLRQVATILRDQGIRFGLEYVGPKTSWTASRHPFIHTMAEARELIAELKLDNVGLVLDSWHWYTAGDTEADLLALTNRDVVACDLNDAPAGIAIDEQRDNARELPAATGVIDLKMFLSALVQIEYDGPVRAEPFNKKLAAMDNEPATAATAAALKRAFALLK